MIKKLDIIIDFLLNGAILLLIVLLISIKVSVTVRQNVSLFFDKYSIFKKNTSQIQTYYEISHPECHLTKEALSDKDFCLNNNGIWLYNSKTCLCRPSEVI